MSACGTGDTPAHHRTAFQDPHATEAFLGQPQQHRSFAILSGCGNLKILRQEVEATPGAKKVDAEEKDRLLVSIAERVADYRQGEIEPIDQGHILAWLGQFEKADQCAILRETDRLLSKTYISREHAKKFIMKLTANEKLTGNAPKAFWESAGLLRLQGSSQSQNDMLTLLGEVLEEQFGFGAGREESANRTYVYLDDVSCSGNQIKNDVARWAEEQDARDVAVHIISMVLYRGGHYFAQQRLLSVSRPRNIIVTFWAMLWIENRRAYARNAEVFWPTELPDDEYVNRWKATFGDDDSYFHARSPRGKASTELFSSEEARHTVEQAFLKKGAYIYSLPQDPAQSMRPLGYSRLRSPGFGSTVATYRNCPNNAPLVLWWGDPNGGAPLNQWKPLLQRRTRRCYPGAVFDDFDF